MYIYTKFTPPMLNAEQTQILARGILAVGRDEFVFALREYLGGAPALGVKAVSLPDVLALAMENKDNRRPVITTKTMVKLSIVFSVLVIACAVVCLLLTDIRIVELTCLAIALGLPVSMLYLAAAWNDMETWVTNVLQQRSGLADEETQFRSLSTNPSLLKRSRETASYQTLVPEPRGTIRFRSGERSEITFNESADVSTFLKLSAEDWLNQLKADAEHQQAPPQLRLDWKTIKDWLGGSGDILNTSTPEELSVATSQRQHFVRGFLQYAREGNAPTPELDEVFIKYRRWLIEIYPSESDLDVKLTPEIRAVFGRMLGGF